MAQNAPLLAAALNEPPVEQARCLLNGLYLGLISRLNADLSAWPLSFNAPSLAAWVLYFFV